MSQIKSTDIADKDIENIEVLNNLTRRIIGIAINVHNRVGPGFVEKIYSDILAYEFKKSKVKFEKEAEIKVKYDNLEFG